MERHWQETEGMREREKENRAYRWSVPDRNSSTSPSSTSARSSQLCRQKHWRSQIWPPDIVFWLKPGGACWKSTGKEGAGGEKKRSDGGSAGKWKVVRVQVWRIWGFPQWKQHLMRRWFMTRTAGWDPCAVLQNLPGSQSLFFGGAGVSKIEFRQREENSKLSSELLEQRLQCGSWSCPNTQREINQSKKKKAETQTTAFLAHTVYINLLGSMEIGSLGP